MKIAKRGTGDWMMYQFSEAIAAAENIEAGEEEVEQELEKMAEMYNMEVAQIKQMLQLQGGTDALKQDLKIRKAVEFLVENSKVSAK